MPRSQPRDPAALHSAEALLPGVVPEACSMPEWPRAAWDAARGRVEALEVQFDALRAAYDWRRQPAPALGWLSKVAVWMGGGTVDAGEPLGKIYAGWWEGWVLGRLTEESDHYVVRWHMYDTCDIVLLRRHDYLNRYSRHAWYQLQAGGGQVPVVGAEADSSNSSSSTSSSSSSDETSSRADSSHSPPAKRRRTAAGSEQPDGADLSYEPSEMTDTDSDEDGEGEDDTSGDEADDKPGTVDPKLGFDKTRCKQPFKKRWAAAGLRGLVGVVDSKLRASAPATVASTVAEQLQTVHAARLQRRIAQFFTRLKDEVLMQARADQVIGNNRHIKAAELKELDFKWRRLVPAFYAMCRAYQRFLKESYRITVYPAVLMTEVLPDFATEFGKVCGIPGNTVGRIRYRTKVQEYRRSRRAEG